MWIGLLSFKCRVDRKTEKSFIQQIELANEVNKSLMLHIRNNPKNKEFNAYTDTLELLKSIQK